MVDYKVYLLGTPRLEEGGQPIVITLRKALALFVYLVITRYPHSRDALATLFWPEKDQQSARGNLRRTLYDLSQLLGSPLSEQLLTIGPETVSVQTDADLWVDVAIFQQCLATALPTAQSPTLDSESVLALTTAAELYTADFLAGFTLPDCPAFTEWQIFKREELQRGYIRLLQQLVMFYEERAKFDEAVRYARRWLQIEGLEESVHRQLMRLYAQAGQQAAALRQYEECVRILAEELDAQPTAETTALYAAIRAKRLLPEDKRAVSHPLARPVSTTARQNATGPGDLIADSPGPSGTPPPHNLPTQTTPFVGRVQELADILQRLSDPACRLLTLVGPGGIGKSRLAIGVAQKILAVGVSETQPPLDALFDSGAAGQDKPKSTIQTLKFQDGLFFVPLQSLTAASEVAPAIATAIGFQFSGSAPPQQQLLSTLQNKHLLLILDNFEHVAAAVDLLLAILAHAPNVKLLVTAREALKLQEEWFHPVAGMRLPPYGAILDRQQDADQPLVPIATYDAVQLFSQAARRALITFQPEAHQTEIARLCHLVDGMPLALELAAAWLKVLTCTQIVDEVERGIDILTARHQNVPARQRSMRAIFDQTWAQLSRQEQQVLAALSVFRGNLSEAAAVSVAGASPFLLGALIDRGLVQVQMTASPVMYSLHELVRQYAASKLQEQPTIAAQVANRHCGYYANLLQRLEAEFRTANSAEAYAVMQREWANLVVAWDEAVANGTHATIDHFANSLGHFHQLNNWFAAGCQFLQPAITRLQAEAMDQPVGMAVLAKLLGWQGDFYLVQDQVTTGETCLLTALTLAQQTGQTATQARALCKLADIAHANKDRLRAQTLAQSAVAAYQQIGDEMGVAWIFIRLGKFALDENKYTQAKERFLAALQLCRKHRYHTNISIVLGYLGRLTLQTGAAIEAARYFQEALQIHDLAAGPYFLEALVQGLGAVAEAQGDYQTAQKHYAQSLAFSRNNGALSDVAYALTPLGELARKTGDYVTARRYLEEALQLHEQVGEQRGMAEIYHRLGRLAQSEGDYVTAAQQYTTSLQLFTASSTPLGQVMVQQGLGQVAQVMGNHGTAYTHYRAALHLALALEAQPFVLDVLVCLADYFLTNQHTSTDQLNAALLLTIINRQHAATVETRTTAQALLAQLRSLAPQLVAQAQQLTGARPLTEILAEIGLAFDVPPIGIKLEGSHGLG